MIDMTFRDDSAKSSLLIMPLRIAERVYHSMAHFNLKEALAEKILLAVALVNGVTWSSSLCLGQEIHVSRSALF
jgi:hypothetical protein